MPPAGWRELPVTVVPREKVFFFFLLRSRCGCRPHLPPTETLSKAFKSPRGMAILPHTSRVRRRTRYRALCNGALRRERIEVFVEFTYISEDTAQVSHLCPCRRRCPPAILLTRHLLSLQGGSAVVATRWRKSESRSLRVRPAMLDMGEMQEQDEANQLHCYADCHAGCCHAIACQRRRRPQQCLKRFHKWCSGAAGGDLHDQLHSSFAMPEL
jgi:hypothetical protein